MFTFPDSLAKALFQYPTGRQYQFTTQVSRFVGGTEQRYGIANTPFRRWDAQPASLKDEEWSELASFFELVNGTASSFAFTDPWDGSVCPVCFFASDVLTIQAIGQGRTVVTFAITEGRVQS